MHEGDSTAKDRGWRAIFERHNIGAHDFSAEPYYIAAEQIKLACQHFRQTAEKEVRILCMQTTREMRPRVFAEHGIFILPVRNGEYVLVRGEGYADIPQIAAPIKSYNSKLEFVPRSAFVGDSEMQHLDYAYAASMLRDFIGDPSLILTIRGRKYTPEFSFNVGGFRIVAESVQVEVDGGYEGKNGIVLVEAKNTGVDNTIIRQLYYPHRKWRINTGLPVSAVFFEKRGADEFHFWEFVFDDEENYNSIRLKRSARYRLSE